MLTTFRQSHPHTAIGSTWISGWMCKRMRKESYSGSVTGPQSDLARTRTACVKSGRRTVRHPKQHWNDQRAFLRVNELERTHCIIVESLNTRWQCHQKRVIHVRCPSFEVSILKHSFRWSTTNDSKLERTLRQIVILSEIIEFEHLRNPIEYVGQTSESSTGHNLISRRALSSRAGVLSRGETSPNLVNSRSKVRF